jgi:hypothetical protein
MLDHPTRTELNTNRQTFIGGSDARIVIGDDEAALLRLWREKRGEIEPEDLSGNLIVQLGVVPEPLNRHWFERNRGRAVKLVQRRICHPVNRWMGAELMNPETSLVVMGDDESALLRLWMKKMPRGYLRLRCRGFRSRRPSPPPFSSMNSIPARSKAARIASTAPRETSRRSFSKSTTVESPSSAACASWDCVISSSPRAARHWAGVMRSTFFVDTPYPVSYQ